MFNKHKIFLSFSLFFLISNPAFAELLWPFQTGTVYQFSNSDSSGANWTAQAEVLEEVTLGSRRYFHLREWNYEQGDIFDFFTRTTDTAVYVWNGDGGDGEGRVFQIAPVGTKWSYLDWDGEVTVAEIIAIEPVTVPYGGPYTAYVHQKYEPSENSPYRYEYVVLGLGFIKAVDYWFDNPPMVMELTRICRNSEKCCFIDVPLGNWAEDAICKIFNAGITKGCSQNPLKYCPFDPVTRAQMAAFIVRAAEGEPPANYCDTGSPFSDVPADTWSCKYIKRLSELEITKGCGPGVYCPNDNVTRAEMAAFIIRAVKEEPPADYCDTGSPFSDVPANSWPCKYIKRLLELEITKGCGPGIYCPDRNVTRAEMAAFLARAFLGMD